MKDELLFCPLGSPIKTKVKIDKNITIKGLIKTLEILT